MARRITDYDGLAEYLDTTVRQLRDLKFRGDLPFLKVGRLIRFDLDEIDRWLEDQRARAS